MATTSIWRVKGWLGKVVIYVENPDKTENPAFYERQDMIDRQAQGLSDVIDYAVNSEKTQAAGETTEVMQGGWMMRNGQREFVPPQQVAPGRRGRIVLERLQSSYTQANTRLLLQLEFIGFTRLSLGANPLSSLKDNIPRYQYLREQVSPPSRFSQYD